MRTAGRFAFIAFILTAFVLTQGRAQDSEIQLNVKFYRLSEKAYPALLPNEVEYIQSGDEFSANLKAWAKNNPKLFQMLKMQEIATIEVAAEEIGGIGSDVPFFREAKRKAAELGANVIIWESGTVFSSTNRPTGKTFQAARITYSGDNGEMLVPVAIFAQRAKPIKKSDFEKILTSLDKERESATKSKSVKDSD